ncbi:MAG TPA: molybdenum cofactor biosynthesis protein MoaE [Acidimicrobiales bacterium]|nr:molybdenum cofactor biosynthesis protein MoaE [Acidimicrobiales bacterium]
MTTSAETELEARVRVESEEVAVSPPASGDDWIGLLRTALPVDETSRWAVVPGCGAVVTFNGTVRDHSDGREGVTDLFYEAYEEQVGPRLAELADAARRRWPDIGRVVLLHRVGLLRVTDTAVVVAVSTPHRSEAFDAARYCIDTLKATVPIWKRESWQGGEAWGACHHIEAVETATADGRPWRAGAQG